jgi:HSP20 family molecular chaperone IbpA
MTTEMTPKSHTSKQPAILQMIDGDPFLRRVGQLYDILNRRAYELFEGRGREHGHDLDDWLHAESEMLSPLPVEISEADGELMVRAEVPPGFRDKDIEVRVQPHRVMISGKREQVHDQRKRKTIYSDRRSNEIFRLIDLSEEIDPGRVRATWHDGALEVELPKAHPSRRIPVATRAA